MKIETERLNLRPVSNEEIRALIDCEQNPEMKQAYTQMLAGCIREPENRVWYTVWVMELKNSPGTIAGDFCFKGRNPEGMVEIGYGLRDGFCGKGYMTECVRAAAAWALSQQGISVVEAETEPDNTASQRVLLSSGFLPTDEIGEEGPRYRFENQQARRHV